MTTSIALCQRGGGGGGEGIHKTKRLKKVFSDFFLLIQQANEMR